MIYTFFIGGLTGGGAERVLCNLANYLIERDNEVEIVTMAESSSYTLHSKISRVVLLKDCERSNFIANTFKRYIRLKRYVKKRKCDAYIVMLPITTILLLSLRRYIDAPIIASERSFPPAIYSKLMQKALKAIASRADGWVFQTPNTMDWYAPYLKHSTPIVIPNAVNEAFLRPINREKRAPNIISIGRLIPSKRFDLLIRAFAQIASKHSEQKLTIYGQGPCLDSLITLSKELGIQDRVFFPGYTTTIADQLEMGRLFVLSSDFEGIPNALIEAMSMGLPCIATDCDGGGAKMLIKHQENGLLIQKNDLDAMVKAMDTLLADDILSEQLARNAIKIREEFSPNVIYGKWEDFANNIITNH